MAIRKVSLDLSQGDVRVIYNDGDGDVVVVATIPTSIDPTTVVGSIVDWLTYAKKAKVICETNLKFRESISIEEEKKEEYKEEKQYKEEEKEAEHLRGRKFLHATNYKPISQGDEPPAWYVEPGSTITVISNINPSNKSVRRDDDILKKGERRHSVLVKTVSNDFVPDDDDKMTIDVGLASKDVDCSPSSNREFYSTSIGSEWEDSYTEYWSYMKTVLGSTCPTSTKTDSWVVGDGPPLEFTYKLCAEYLSKYEVHINTPWQRLSAIDMLDFYQEMIKGDHPVKIRREVAAPIRTKIRQG